jgi:hypothetical protein
MKRFLWLICGFALLLVACATTDVESVWKDETHTGRLNKVFVLAVLKEPASRDSVEYGIANILNGDHLRAIPTLDSFPNIDEIDKTLAAEMITEYGIDGVLLVRLVDRRVEKVYSGGPAYYDGFYGNRYRGGWYNYYRGGYNAFMAPGYVTENYISTVETAIYDIATEQVLWSMITETRENEVPKAIASYLATISKSLADSGLF